MSTRCQVGFYREDNKPLSGFTALVYRHSDGYPESENGVLASLVPFCEKFQKGRGLSDASYAAAWFVHDQISEYGGSEFLGYGIDNVVHGDIDYFYAVYPTQIEVYEVDHDHIEYQPEGKKRGTVRPLGGMTFTLKEIIEIK